MGQGVSSAAPDPEGGQQQGQQQGSWWLRLLARALGTVGALICMILGIWACVSFSAICLVAGLTQIVSGFIVMLLEAPCCCQFVEFADKISKFTDSRPPWQKAVLYIVLSIPPVLMCIELSTFFGSGLIFLDGVVYGVMALGKKADRNTMMARAAKDETEMTVTLLENETPPASSTPMQSVPTGP